jgi:hypothetical protein
MDQRDKHCRICGEKFLAKSATHKYCSRECETRAYRERKGFVLGKGRHCRQCGTKFFPDFATGANRQHCSDECAVKSARESRCEFYKKNPQKYFEYHAKSRQKHGPDANMKRFLARHPDAPKSCQSCGESRVLDIAHKPEFRRNGAWRSSRNTTLDKVWILCPTCHALIDRKGILPNQLGLS